MELEGLRLAVEHAARLSYPSTTVVCVPCEDGRSLLLVPGFLASDRMLGTLFLWQRRRGYWPGFAGAAWEVRQAALICALHQLALVQKTGSTADRPGEPRYATYGTAGSRPRPASWRRSGPSWRRCGAPGWGKSRVAAQAACSDRDQARPWRFCPSSSLDRGASLSANQRRMELGDRRADLRRQLVDAVLRGNKTATASLR